MPEPMKTGTLANFLHLADLFKFGRLGGSRSCDDDCVDKEELGLLNDIGNVEIASERMRAMLLFHVGENFDMFAAEAYAFTQQAPRASFDQAGAADVREDVSSPRAENRDRPRKRSPGRSRWPLQAVEYRWVPRSVFGPPGRCASSARRRVDPEEA